MKAQSFPFLIVFTLFFLQPSVVLSEDDLVPFPFDELTCKFSGDWIERLTPEGRTLIAIEATKITCLEKTLELTSPKIKMEERKGILPTLSYGNIIVKEDSLDGKNTITLWVTQNQRAQIINDFKN